MKNKMTTTRKILIKVDKPEKIYFNSLFELLSLIVKTENDGRKITKIKFNKRGEK